MARFRNVVFTWNNPEGLIEFLGDKMVYLVYQEEIGESGTHHFQGYCEFTDQVAFNAAKEMLGGATVHLERRRGTQAQAIAYAKKEDTRIDGPYEFGVPKTQGKRSDLEDFKNEVIGGKRKRDLIDDHYQTLARYPRFYDTISALTRPRRSDDGDFKVTLLIGDTGLGKTRYVMDLYADNPDFYVAPLNNGTMWYDGFDGHSVVLLDDFAGASSHISLGSLLRLLDRYPVSVPTKGSHTWWLPSQVFVTTNILPRDWYKWENRRNQYDALARRFHSVKMFYIPLSAVDPGFIEQERSWWEENSPLPTSLHALN